MDIIRNVRSLLNQGGGSKKSQTNLKRCNGKRINGSSNIPVSVDDEGPHDLDVCDAESAEGCHSSGCEHGNLGGSQSVDDLSNHNKSNYGNPILDPASPTNCSCGRQGQSPSRVGPGPTPDSPVAPHCSGANSIGGDGDGDGDGDGNEGQRSFHSSLRRSDGMRRLGSALGRLVETEGEGDHNVNDDSILASPHQHPGRLSFDLEGFSSGSSVLDRVDEALASAHISGGHATCKASLGRSISGDSGRKATQVVHATAVSEDLWPGLAGSGGLVSAKGPATAFHDIPLSVQQQGLPNITQPASSLPQDLFTPGQQGQAHSLQHTRSSHAPSSRRCSGSDDEDMDDQDLDPGIYEEDDQALYARLAASFRFRAPESPVGQSLTHSKALSRIESRRVGGTPWSQKNPLEIDADTLYLTDKRLGVGAEAEVWEARYHEQVGADAVGRGAGGCGSRLY